MRVKLLPAIFFLGLSSALSAQGITRSFGAGFSVAIVGHPDLQALPAPVFGAEFATAFDLSSGGSFLAIEFTAGTAWNDRSALSGAGYFYRAFWSVFALVELRWQRHSDMIGLPLACDIGAGAAMGTYSGSTLAFFYPFIRFAPSVSASVAEGLYLRISVPIQASFLFDSARFSVGLACALEWPPEGLVVKGDGE